MTSLCQYLFYGTFFRTLEECNLRAAENVSSITGANITDLLLED